MNIWAIIALVALALVVPLIALITGTLGDELDWSVVVFILGVSVTLADFIYLSIL
jgi:hypothetical protein